VIAPVKLTRIPSVYKMRAVTGRKEETMMHGNGMMEGMPMMGAFGWIFMLLFWGFAIAGIIFMVRWLLSGGKSGKEDGPHQSPLDILKSRYARGEITEEEYNRIKKDLE
jgi:putative membrane protein